MTKLLRFLLVCWVFLGVAQAQSVSLPSTAIVGQNVAATLTFGVDTLVIIEIQWGDGDVTPVSFGALGTTRVVNHVFSAAGTFKVQVVCQFQKNGIPSQPIQASRVSKNAAQGNCPQVFGVITVSYPSMGLSLAPGAVQPNQNVTALLSGLVSSLSYTLDWGDGTIQDIGGRSSFTATHSYSLAKTYTVRLSNTRNFVPPQIATVTVANLIPILEVSPLNVGINEDVTASLGQLSTSLTYTLEWGDGTSESITGLGSTVRKKKYASSGTKIIKLSASGVVPQIATVVVSVSTPTLEVKPDEIKAGVAQATIDGLAASVTYSLDWGDGSSPDSLTGVTSTKLQHSYPASGKPVYVVKLTYPGGVVTATISLTSSCQIVFNPSNPNPNQAVKTTITGLVANSAYTIIWGDDTQDSMTSSSTGAATSNHTFTASKIYTVQVRLENKLICLGSLNVGAVTVVANIIIESFTQAGLVIKNAYPDETVNIILEPLTIGLNYTLDYGDARAKLSFKADQKKRVVPAWYSTQKTFTLTLVQPAKSVSTTLQVGLPVAKETLKLRGEARAELPSIFDLSKLLKKQKYEIEFGNSSKGNVKIAVVTAADIEFDSGESSTTYKKAGDFEVNLIWLGEKGTRVKRASTKIKVLEAFTAQILATSLYFIVNKNAVTKFDSTKFGENKLRAAELTIVYTGFGLLEGDVLTDNKATSSLKIELKKNGGVDAGNGKRRLVVAFKNFVLQPIGTRKITFLPTKLNGAVFKGTADQPLEIFVYPKRFFLAGFDFEVDFAQGSLESMNGKAKVKLVFAGKDFGMLNVDFKELTAQALIDAEKSISTKLVFIPGQAYISKGSIEKYLGSQQFNTLGKIRVELSKVLFEVGGTKFSGAVRIPYPTCNIPVIVTQKPPPNKETKPDPKTIIIPEKNDPYPPDGFTNLITDQLTVIAADKFGEAISENLNMQQLAGLGAVNFAVPIVQKIGASTRASRLVRASSQVPKISNQNINPNNLNINPNLGTAAPTAMYEYIVPLNQVQLDSNGGLYLENAEATIEGYVANNTSSLTKTLGVRGYNANDPDFGLACSGVVMPSPATLTIDLSQSKSPASDALLDTYGGTNKAPSVGPEWRGVLFPKASTELSFVETSSYGAKAAEQGFSLKDPIPANVTYQGGYNWSITKNQGLGAGVVNAWKFNISSFGMSMYHSKVVDGGGQGTFFLPFFVLDSPGRFYIGAVGYNVSPTWEIVTDEFIQKDFGSSSVVAGCGVFAHESGSYPIKFDSAYWAVKRLVKTPSNIQFKNQSQPLESGGYRKYQGSIFKQGLTSHYEKMRLNGGIDKVSHCDPLKALEGMVSTDAGSQIKMPNLRVFPSADIDMDGQTWRSISAPNLEIAGQTFPANQLGIGKNPDGTHFIALRSDSYRLAPCEQSNASDCLPAVSTEIRYPIQNGKDLGKVVLKGFTIASTVNQNTKFKQTFADQEIKLVGKLYALENAPSEAWLEKSNKNTGNLAAASNDFCFESSNSGFCPEPSPVSAASNTMNMGGIAVTAQMFVRRQNGKVSWGVYAGALSDTPLASLFGVVNVYGLYGGIVYNKRWDANGAYNNLATDFAFNKLQPASGLQVIAGTVFTVLDGSSFHGAGVLFIDLNDAFAITINVTGWLLEPYAAGSGYLGNKPPQARALIQINSSGLSADLCVGNTGTPPNAKIQCQGLANLKLAGIAEIQGYASLAVGSQNHIYIGTYNNPISLTVFPGSSAFKTTATGYLMLGQVDSNAGIPPTATASSGSVTGLYAGFAIKRDIQVGDSGSIDLVLASCNWSWYAKAGWAVSADFGLTVQPAFEMGAKFSASAYAGAGVSGCGVGIDIGITGSISGTIKVTSSSAVASYTFSGSISTPSPLPDINFSKSGDLNLY